MAVGQGVAGTLTYSPRADAAERLPHWVIRHASLHGLHEGLCWRRHVILLDSCRSQAERRSDLAHAIAHVDLGHRSTSHQFFATKDEAAAATRLAVKRMLGIRNVGEVLALFDQNRDLAAEEMSVDRTTLDVRLEHLHPSERAYLKRRLAADGTV